MYQAADGLVVVTRDARAYAIVPVRRAMATCPRCKGHLTENHRCPRSPARRIFETALAASGGGLIALLLFSIADPQAQWTVDGAVLVGGALVGLGLDRFLRT